MYELIILSILMQQPAHGYLIAKIVNSYLGPFAKVNNGRLYPLLANMQEKGLIKPSEQVPAEQENGRQINSFEITEAGIKHFHGLMMDTTSNPGDYQKIFWLKAGQLMYLSLNERLQLIDHYLNYCQNHVLYLGTKVDHLKFAGTGEIEPIHHSAILETLEHRVEHWQQEYKWATNLRNRELAKV